MSWINLLGIAVALSMDAFAVSIAAGLAVAQVTPRHTFRIGFHFGLFQCLMPIVGWLAGLSVARFIQVYDHWVAFALLVYVGGKMIHESRQPPDAEARRDPTRGLMLVTLSVATSIDALAVGLSMALIGVSVWVPAVVIGLITGTLSTIGILCAGWFGRRWGGWAELAGGIVLLLIAIHIVVQH